MRTPSICLVFDDAVDPLVRGRMNYSFQVFAAVYGYTVALDSEGAGTRCFYGNHPRRDRAPKEFWIPARYEARRRTGNAPAPQRRRYANEDFFLVYGVDGRTGDPDWLGEIFEWVSAAFERGVEERDPEGRIPYRASLFEKQGISPFKPHAGLLMAWLENALRGNSKTEALPRAKSPLPGVDHAVVCSHDIDFYYTGKRDAFRRIGKNLAISVIDYRSPSFLFSNLGMAADLARGGRTGDYISKMVEAIEAAGFRSTLFAVAGGNHRRDPNYRLEEIQRHLRHAAARGFGVGVHASYESASRPGTVKEETAALGKALREPPQGSRQHWLRFGSHQSLYKQVEEAGLTYDSSLGFSETCGFRNGANFAFPPYDFENERPCPFLEIPLVIMDGSLFAAARRLRREPQSVADEILKESRSLGWGGIAVLWHNPMEALQVPEAINRVFWKCAGERKLCGEEWMSAESFLKAILPQYHRAGLLREIGADA